MAKKPITSVSAPTTNQSEVCSADYVKQFLDECCFLDDNVKVARSDLYEAFVRWGGKMSKRDFGTVMSKAGFGKARMRAGDLAWTGLAEQIYLDHGMEVPV